MPAYYDYLKNQTKEILEQHGAGDVVGWRVGGPLGAETATTTSTRGLEGQEAASSSTGLAGDGMAGTTEQSEANFGDYDTPEQRVGGFNRERPWESRLIIRRQWSVEPDDDRTGAKKNASKRCSGLSAVTAICY